MLMGSRRTATRVMFGAICLSSSSHFPLIPYSNRIKTGRVAARPARVVDEAGADRVERLETRSVRCVVAVQQRAHALPTGGEDNIRRQCNQFRRVSCGCCRAFAAPQRYRSARCGRRSSPIPAALARTPSDVRQSPDRSQRALREHTDPPHPLRLLRPRRERPRRRRAAEQRDELAPLSFDHLVGAGE